jgi:hypothetical protein
MPPRPRSSAPAVRLIHRHQWLWEPLEDDPGFLLRAMFGAKAVYLDGKLMLAFCAGEEPWRGVLVCTDHAHHGSLRQQWPDLANHPILPKWLYLPETCGAFERVAEQLVARVRQRDPRFGVLPRPKKPRRTPARTTTSRRSARP